MTLLMDSQTILLSLGIGYLFTLVLIAAYWHDSIKSASVKTYFLAKCAQTTAWVCMIFRGQIADFLSISFANSILLLGASLEIIALLGLLGTLRPLAKRLIIAAGCASVAGFQLVLLLINEENIRIIYCSFVFAAILFPAYRMLFGRGRTLLMRVMGFLYMVIACGSVFRGASTMLADASTSFYKPGMYQLVWLLSIYLITIMLNMGFVLLLKENTNKELVRLASYDDLTGTLNRRTFAAKAKDSLSEHARKGQPLSYLLFDIDWFKTINDTHGHHVGDQVLQDLAARIRQQLGKDDLFVRYGGDEFGILLPGKDEAASSEIAEVILQTLRGSGTVLAPLPVTYSISMGILTTVPNARTQLEALYTTCDKALYMAKSNGRDGLYRSWLQEHHAVS
ncbi:GGDEF domain-containing protein [Paenibacillus silvisoli]|uniref:GGDEF domain-containing protein n=1 Tax=Paenibacillus silvisoli TaxID=3110539 RepID=UPI002805BE4F|nr:GGDEF domain-containing protein [Paenibacillus silvisoli]